MRIDKKLFHSFRIDFMSARVIVLKEEKGVVKNGEVEFMDARPSLHR